MAEYLRALEAELREIKEWLPMIIHDVCETNLQKKPHLNVSEEPRIRSQKLHCQCCVYLDALLKTAKSGRNCVHVQ